MIRCMCLEQKGEKINYMKFYVAAFLIVYEYFCCACEQNFIPFSSKYNETSIHALQINNELCAHFNKDIVSSLKCEHKDNPVVPTMLTQSLLVSKLQDFHKSFISVSQPVYSEGRSIQDVLLQIMDEKFSSNLDFFFNDIQQHDPDRWKFYINNYKDRKTGYTLFIQAAIRSDVVMMRFLQKSGANFNASDFNGRTALHKVVDSSDVLWRVHPFDRSLVSYFIGTSLDFLLECECLNPNIQDKDGNTPLHVALEEGLSDDMITKLIISFKANIALKNDLGQTARDIALHKKRISIIKLLDAQNSAQIMIMKNCRNDLDKQSKPRIRSYSENDRSDQKQVDKNVNSQPFLKTQTMSYPAPKQSYIPTGYILQQQAVRSCKIAQIQNNK